MRYPQLQSYGGHSVRHLTKPAFVVGIGLTFAVSGCGDTNQTSLDANDAPVICEQISSAPVKIDGGTFSMGSNAVYAEEGPVRETSVDSFWIDPHEVTNAQFAEFVAATGHITVAEKPVDPNEFGVSVEDIPADLLKAGSAVFIPPNEAAFDRRDWWQYVPGANWQMPFGPEAAAAQPNEPVVHLAWDDMVAYADWKGGRLPTEAEWEYAASAGAQDRIEQPATDLANSWQGIFPIMNDGEDGFAGLAPVGCFKPNDFGLYDMVGNVWEITSDFYRPGHDPDDRNNPSGPSQSDAARALDSGLVTRVMKGGSYLCAPNYCRRYRAESRQGNDSGLGSSNVGFRLAYDAAPAP